MLPRDVVLYVNKNILMMLIENVQNALNQLTHKKTFIRKIVKSTILKIL